MIHKNTIMKRFLQLALALAITAVTPVRCFSQLSIGIEGGPAITNLVAKRENARPSFTYSRDYTLPFGLFCTRTIGHGFSVVTGITYSPVGAAITDLHPLLGQFNEDSLYTDCFSDLRLH